MNLPLLAVTSGPLDPGKLTHAVAVEHARRAAAEGRPGPGAVDTFVGVVRGHNLGRVVEHLEYEAFEPLALKAFSRIVDEIDERWAGCVVGIHHRTGRLEVGETSVVIAAASAHRGDAFAASRYAIERLKQIAPIWKHEYFEGGDVWIGGATADPDDDHAREEAQRRACMSP